MAEQLKNIFFSNNMLDMLGSTIHNTYPKFTKKDFINYVLNDNWKNLELKERMSHVALALNKFLPEKFETQIEILKQTAPHFNGFDGMIFPDFIEKFGKDHWELSLNSLREFTKYSSSEFAIRPFIISHKDKALQFLCECANDENEHVRRFASEGCRPRLPWSIALPELKKDPTAIIQILETLKDDKSEYVRKSVANNINDISKDNPEIALNLCKKWYGKSGRTNWIVKHGLRSLLKSGNKEALKLFGFGSTSKVKINDLELSSQKLNIGENLSFSFLLVNSNTKAKIRAEYKIEFQTKSGKLSQKVFQISEKEYTQGEYPVKKSHSFKDYTTRKHFPGKHKLMIIINGEIMEESGFELLLA